MSAPTLTTERLILRRPSPADAGLAADFWQSERAEFVGGDASRFRAWSNFAAMLGHWEILGFGLWAVTEKGDDAILGLVGPYCPDGWPEHELGWLLFEGAEGKGIAYEAALAARDDARARLGWQEIVSYIAPGNERSVKLAERLGGVLDENAVPPKAGFPTLIYRHPATERAQAEALV